MKSTYLYGYVVPYVRGFRRGNEVWGTRGILFERGVQRGVEGLEDTFGTANMRCDILLMSVPSYKTKEQT